MTEDAPPAKKPSKPRKSRKAPVEASTAPPLPTITGSALDAHLKERTDAAAKKRAGRVTKQSMRKNAQKAHNVPNVHSDPSTTPGPEIVGPGQAVATNLKVPAGKVKREKLNEHGLTEKQERFCHEYVLDLNGAQAAARTGYTRTSAHVIASQLLAIPKVWQRVQGLKAEMYKRLDVSHERIVRELTIMAYANIADYLTTDGKGNVNLDIATVMQQAPHLMAGITGYEIVEMEGAMELDPAGGEMKFRPVLKHKIKTEKVRALELLMKHKRMFAPEENLSPEALEALVERMKTDLRLKKASLQAQLMIEKQGGAAGVPTDVQDAEFVTMED